MEESLSGTSANDNKKIPEDCNSKCANNVDIVHEKIRILFTHFRFRGC